MTELTKNVPFIWNHSAEKAFEDLKSAVTEAHVLNTFDPTEEIFVVTDASE